MTEDKTFDHIWICSSRKNDMDTIISKIKSYLKTIINSKLIEKDTNPFVNNQFINDFAC